MINIKLVWCCVLILLIMWWLGCVYWNNLSLSFSFSIGSTCDLSLEEIYMIILIIEKFELMIIIIIKIYIYLLEWLLLLLFYQRLFNCCVLFNQYQLTSPCLNLFSVICSLRIFSSFFSLITTNLIRIQTLQFSFLNCLICALYLTPCVFLFLRKIIWSISTCCIYIFIFTQIFNYKFLYKFLCDKSFFKYN